MGHQRHRSGLLAVCLLFGLVLNGCVKQQVQVRVASGEIVTVAEPVYTPVECLLSTAQAEVGTKEQGRNRGKRVSEYLASCDLKPGHPWCAAFVKWCFTECDIETPGANAFCPSWFPKERVVYTRQRGAIEQGDVVGFYVREKKRIAHQGIAWKVEDKYVVTIEGNTNLQGSRDGDGVELKRRAIETISKASRWL